MAGWIVVSMCGVGGARVDALKEMSLWGFAAAWSLCIETERDMPTVMGCIVLSWECHVLVVFSL